MSAYHEQAIDISSLPTRSATFYTSSAAVVRDVPVVVKVLVPPSFELSANPTSPAAMSTPSPASRPILMSPPSE